MENKPDQNLFREVHRKVQDIREKARKNRADAERSWQAREDEAQAENLDLPAPASSDEPQP